MRPVNAPPAGRLELVCAPRTEDLLDRFLQDMAGSLSVDPLARACVIVQNRGMARWLELQCSARLGVWANPWFPFPRTFVEWLVRQARDEGADLGPTVDVDALRWTVAAVLPPLLGEPAFEPIRWWMRSKDDPARLLALAGRIAGVFDRYLLHAPDWLAAWEGGESRVTERDTQDARATEAWQSALWRDVVTRMGPERGRASRRTAELAGSLADRLPDAVRRLERVHVFGLSALSPAYMEVLAAVARHMPVAVYALGPSPADAAFVAETVRAVGWRADPPSRPPNEAVHERLLAARDAHPLITGQAGAVRAFQALACTFDAEPVLVGDVATSTPEATLLEAVQADVRAGGAVRAVPDLVRAAIDGADRSVTLHACPGPLREAEVARDQILAAFEEMPDLAPHDVVVMVPDVATYAPYLEAVFGVGRAAGRHIPHRVADRPAVAGRPGAEALQQALDVLLGRMTAPEVLDLLALGAVREARGLELGDIETLKGWLEAAGIRWGIDAAHRNDVGQPGLDPNTWRWGLARLVLGWAAPGDGRHRLGETLPLSAAGAEPETLGVLLDFLALLEGARAELVAPSWPLERWAERLGQLCGELIGTGPDAEDDRVFVETALGRLAVRARAAGFEAPVPLSAVRDLVAEALTSEAPPRGFLEGAVTVCALVPMRAIPFRVVVLVGMNDGVFPRADRAPDFDLAARKRRLGDTTPRETDRLLFLEAVLSARDRLVVTWSGRDPVSDTKLPPSVVVAELLDVLRAMGEDGRQADERGQAERALVQDHPLHPFSPRYYAPRRGKRWFSFTPEPFGPDPILARTGRPALVPEPLPEPAPDGAWGPVREIRLDALAGFLESPARRLVRDRLGVALPRESAPLREREPMTMDALETWHVGETIVGALRDGATLEEAVAAARAGGRLPLGTPGTLAVAPLAEEACGIAALGALVRGDAIEASAAVALSVAADDLQLVGRLDGLFPAGRLEVGFGKLNDKRKLRLWVRHLVLCVARDAGLVTGAAPVSWAVGRAEGGNGLGALRIGPVAEAGIVLEGIVALWREAESRLLPFYPNAARAYVREVGAVATDDEPDEAVVSRALRKAASVFGAGGPAASHRYAKPDLADPYLALAIGDELPWETDGQTRDPAAVARFQELARQIYGPLEAAIEVAPKGQAATWLQRRLAAGDEATGS